MDAGSEILIELVKLDDARRRPDAEGAVLVRRRAEGPEDGPDPRSSAATRRCCPRARPTASSGGAPGVVLMQTIGRCADAVERWADICQTV